MTCLRCGAPLGAALAVADGVGAAFAGGAVPAAAIGTIGPNPELKIAQTQMIERPLKLRIGHYDTGYPYWFQRFAGFSERETTDGLGQARTQSQNEPQKSGEAPKGCVVERQPPRCFRRSEVALRTSALRLAAQPRAHCGATSCAAPPDVSVELQRRRAHSRLGRFERALRSRFSVVTCFDRSLPPMARCETFR